MQSIQSSIPQSQWVVWWDEEASGYRASAGDLQTGSYVNPEAALKAAKSGAATREAGGLVSYQQSTTTATSEPPAPAESGPESSATALSEVMAQIRARRATRAAEPERASDPAAAPAPALPGKVDYTRPYSWVDYQEYKRLRVAKAEARQAARKTAAKAERQARAADRALEAEGKYQQAKNRVVTVSDGNQVLSFSSHEGRVRRAQRRVHAWAEALPKDKRKIQRGTQLIDLGPRMVMLTLTYGPDYSWEKRDITNFLKKVKRKLGKNLLGVAWVAEMQERGEVHYHVLLYCKRGTKVPKPDEAGWWTKGSTNIKTAKTAFYICKYVGKEKQKEGLPKGARMYAVWINKDVITDEERLAFRLSAVPSWLHEVIKDTAEKVGPKLKWARAPGGGWVIKDTGERIYSPWFLVAIDDYVLYPLLTGREVY